MVNESQPRSYKRFVGFALRVGLAAAVVWWLVREAAWDEVISRVSHADPWFLLLAAGALSCECVAKVWNWGQLLHHLGCGTRGHMWRLGQVYMVASMAASVLPSTASTDAMRGLMAQRLFGGRPTAHAAAII